MLPVWMNKHGFTLTITLNALKVRWLTIPKEHPPSIVSQLQLAPFTQVPSVHPGTQSKNMELFSASFPSFLTSSNNPSAFSSEAVWMCKCYLYIVCTLMFCQKEFLQCSITALTAREHRRHKIEKDRAVCFLHSLSEVWSVQGWGFWEFLGGIYFWWLFRTFTEKAPISLWDYSTTEWSHEDPNQHHFVCRAFSPSWVRN